jgi:hypothetical protein
MSMGNRKFVRCDVKDEREAEREWDVAASFAAIISRRGSQEQGRKTSRPGTLEHAGLDRRGGESLSNVGPDSTSDAGDELMRRSSERRSLHSCYVLKWVHDRHQR